jgi:uncharacterized protein YndB with AHSA1/START domain
MNRMTESKNPATFLFPSDREIDMTRVIDAPRELVFRAYTNPDLIPQWWGPEHLMTRVDRMDLRPGGVWRFVQRGSDGSEYVFHGVYREIVPPERLVDTFEFEGMPGHVMLETVTFEGHDGGTKVTVTSLFRTMEDRDGMLGSGMEKGAAESMDRLEKLMAKGPAS